MKRLITINATAALQYWQGMNPQVELTDERMMHIKDHHPGDFDFCVQHIDLSIQDPDIILEDHKNPNTAMFIRCFSETGVNVVIKLSMPNAGDNRSFIVTVHPAGERSIRKLERKNKIVYKRHLDML